MGYSWSAVLCQHTYAEEPRRDVAGSCRVQSELPDLLAQHG